MPAEPIRTDQETGISVARDGSADPHYGGRITYSTCRGQRPAAIIPAGIAEAIERAEDAADVAAARETLARIDAGDEPISLADLRRELGL